jgi:NAD(P)-dependent dehydrogenase (short-subunit alcohol dehydrogenase family)
MKDAVVFVTGGNSGIGLATARLFASRGSHVVIGDLDVAPGRRAAAPDGVAFVQLDVSDEASVMGCFATLDRDLGQLDVLVNCAGTTIVGDVLATSAADFDRVIAVNLRGTFLTCKHAITRMAAAGGGVIVNVASQAGIVGMRERAAYCASKGGVVIFTKAIALDHVGAGIRANAVCPGTIDTPWIERIAQRTDDPERARSEFARRQPMNRMGTPEEIAAAIYFLASDEASFITGTALVADGGWTAE